MHVLEKIGKKLGDWQTKQPGIFLVILAVTLLLTLPGIPLLITNVEPSLEKVLPQEVQEVQRMNEMRAQFGADMMYLLVKADTPTATTIASPDVITFIDIVSNTLRTNERILEVRSIADVMKRANGGRIPESQERIETLLRENPQTSIYLNNNRDLALIHIRSDTGAEASVIRTVYNQITNDLASLENQNPGVTISITGFNTIDKATFETIINDFIIITLFSFLFMLTFLIFYFKSFKNVASSISVIMISLIVTLGLTGYLGITITVVTMVAAAMIMALGISYGINVTYEFNLIKEQHHPKKAIAVLNTHIIRALVGSSFTTSAGFLALLAGVMPAMKNLGIVLAMGILITLLVSIIFLPVILYLFNKKSERTYRNAKKKTRKTN